MPPGSRRSGSREASRKKSPKTGTGQLPKWVTPTPKGWITRKIKVVAEPKVTISLPKDRETKRDRITEQGISPGRYKEVVENARGTFGGLRKKTSSLNGH